MGIASAYTPTPGGTGPVTALVLARKVLADGFAQLGGSLDAVQELKQVIEAGAEQELEESNPPS